MKSFRTLFRYSVALLLASAASLVACKDSDGDPKFGDPITLEIIIDEVTDSSILLTVTPSRTDANYYAQLYTQSGIEGKNDNTLLAECLTDDYFESYIRHGKQTLAFEKLRPETEYVLVAFGYEDEQSTGITSDIVRYTVATLAEQNEQNEQNE